MNLVFAGTWFYLAILNRAEWFRVMPMAARGAKQFTTNLPKSPLQLTTIPRGIFAHGSGGENEFVAERGGDGASGFEQRFQMGLGRLLKAEHGFSPVAPCAWQPGRSDDLAIQTPSSSWRSCTFESGTIIVRVE